MACAGFLPAKVSSPEVMWVASATDRRNVSTRCRDVEPSPSSSARASRWPCITVSRLLNSWATPPENLPITSMRCAKSRPSSIRLSAVMLVMAVRKQGRPSYASRLVCASSRSS